MSGSSFEREKEFFFFSFGGSFFDRKNKNLTRNQKTPKKYINQNSYISPYFVTDPERMVAEYEGCRLLLVDKKISTARDIVGE